MNVHLSVANSTSLEVTFQEPLSVNSAVVTKYKGKAMDCTRQYLPTILLTATDQWIIFDLYPLDGLENY